MGNNCLQFPRKAAVDRKTFSGQLKNIFVCGNFNAPHHKINCSYDSENGEKLLNVIDEGTFKLPNNGYHTYQSFDGKCKYMLDLHSCDNSLLTYFSDFQVSEDLDMNKKNTFTTMNLRKVKFFKLKSKINYRKFRENAQSLYRSSNIWPAKYPKKDELNQFSSSLVEIVQKSLEDSCINKKEFPNKIEFSKKDKKAKRVQNCSWRSLYFFKNGYKLPTERNQTFHEAVRRKKKSKGLGKCL